MLATLDNVKQLSKCNSKTKHKHILVFVKAACLSNLSILFEVTFIIQIPKLDHLDF